MSQKFVNAAAPVLGLDPARHEVIQEVIDIAGLRRDARRESGAFFAGRDYMAAFAIVGSERADQHCREQAGGVIDRTHMFQAALVEILPPIDQYQGARIDGDVLDKRFDIFKEFGQFKNLDLVRRVHQDGDWSAATAIEDGLSLLLKRLSDSAWFGPQSQEMLQFEVERLAAGEPNCGMHIQADLTQLYKNGIVHLVRNTGKATIINNENGDVIQVNKRTEFIIDLSMFDHWLTKRMFIRRLMAGNGSARLTGGLFDCVDKLLTDRHPAITPIYTTLYVYREQQVENQPLAEPEELAVTRA